MEENKFSVSLLIASPPDIVYRIIADYKNSHPKILPNPPFISLVIEEGGFGAGTVMTVIMKVFGKEQKFKSIVTEPEPGHLLVETNDTGYITTFKVEPRDGGRESFVTFTTEIGTNSTLSKRVEFFLSKMYLPLVYKKELENLSKFAQQK